jgi:hypothetical protein
MKRFWRIQNLDAFQDEPSWNSYAQVKPSHPADEDGWEGYWWAHRVVPTSIDRVRVDYNLDFLIRAEDVEKARDEERVDVFVPGLFGCEDVDSMIAYIHQIGGVDEDQFVCLYEGYEYPEYRAFDGVVFGPVRLLAAYPAMEWLERAEQGEFEEEVEE